MTTLTQRSTSGLVQRRTEASRIAAADREKTCDEDEHEERRGDEDEGERGDSKETRLTLMEEVLLLGLKDREVPDSLSRQTHSLIINKCAKITLYESVNRLKPFFLNR